MKRSRINIVVLSLGLSVLCVPITDVVAQRSRTSSQRPQRSSPRSPQTTRELSPEKLASYALPAVGLVVCSDNKSISQGSGFFISPGLLITNYHVIRGMTSGSVRVEISKQKFDMRIAQVLDYDDGIDLAFLWVPDAVQFKIQSLKLLDSDDINVGEAIYALGNPEGLVGTFSPGIISAQERKLKDISYMQISAPISHGSSGGPVINSRGDVVAVVVGSIEEGQNLNFAIPVKYLRAMTPEANRIQAQTLAERPSSGDWVWSKKPVLIRAKELVAAGDSLTESGRLDDAMQSYSAALDLSPGMVEAKRGLGVVYEKKAAPLIDSGKYLEALSLLKHSIEMYGDNYLVYFQLGRTYSSLRQEQSALGAFESSIKLKSDFALGHYAKGLTLIGLDEIDSALEEVSILRPLDAKLASELLDFLSKTILTSKLAVLRQELQSQGTFSIPSQSGSVSVTEMNFFVPTRFAGCELRWRQSTAILATSYGSGTMLSRYTDFELDLKDIDSDRIRLDRNNSGRYYIYLPTRDGRLAISRSSYLSLPDSRGKQKESRSNDATFSASISVKNGNAVDDLINAFKTAAVICGQSAK